jgi:methionine aminotransferase
MHGSRSRWPAVVLCPAPSTMSASALTPSFPSRLPNVGTTIFTVMSALATEHKAVNLGQGFPDFGCDPALIDSVSRAMQAGHNQYPPMTGVPALREVVAQKIEALYGKRYDANSEITVTAGATQAILTVILSCVSPGDEVIVLDPCYDSYVPNIELAGGVPVRVPLTPKTFRPDFGKIAAAITPKTRLLLINTPHNPSGTTWTAQEMQQLQDLLAPTNILLLADEVYEHMVFDGERHESASRYPGLAARAYVVSSFGKTFHVTGWKVATVAAPAPLTAEFRKVHQFNVFTVNTHAGGAGRVFEGPRALPEPAGLLPKEARPVPRRPRRLAPQAPVQLRHLFPMRGYLGRDRCQRSGVLPATGQGPGRCSHSSLRLLWRRL